MNNKLILGTVQMGLDYGINNASGKISLSESHSILGHAFKNGIKILDTAVSYGNAHEVIGNFHDDNSDMQFEIITKLPNQLNIDMSEKVDGFLTSLKVSRIYALLFHSFKTYKDNFQHFDKLVDLRNKKKIKYIGVSVYTNHEIEEVLLNDDIDIIQLPFNLLDNYNLRSDVLKKAKSNGKIIHTRSAFLQGLFFKDINSNNKIVKSLKTELTQIHELSKQNYMSMEQMALNYCAIQPFIDNILVGVDSKKQLQNNLDALESKIDNDTVKNLNQIKVEDIKLLNPSLW